MVGKGPPQLGTPTRLSLHDRQKMWSINIGPVFSIENNIVSKE
jgi:hypothetical protein